MEFHSFENAPLSLGLCDGRSRKIVLPGDRVTDNSSGYLKGRGVEVNADGDFISTQCGVVETVNKLIYVTPMYQQYKGDIGDVVVGKILQVLDNRWTVEVGSHKSAALQLAAVSLPDAAQRKRTDEDAINMREIFAENDIIVAEVQKVTENADIKLQTRTSKYGRLYNGLLVRVSPSLVRRQPAHFVSPTPEIIIILGANGWIWIGSKQKLAGQGIQTLNYAQIEAKNITVEEELRAKIVRYANCIRALNKYGVNITMNVINHLYQKFAEHGIIANSPQEWSQIESFLATFMGA